MNSTEIAQKFDQEWSWAEKQVASHPAIALGVIVFLLVVEVLRFIP